MFQVLLIVLFLLVVVLLIAATKHKYAMVFQALVMFIAVGILMVHVMRSKQIRAESFIDMPSTTTTTTTASGDDENIAPISNSLTTYVSSFSSLSYKTSGDSRIWVNIAPSTNTSTSTCANDAMAKNFMFDTAPQTTTPDKGFFLKQHRILGPKSYLLGINGDTSYTMFFVMKFESFNSNENYELFKLFANVESTNGLSMFISKGSVLKMDREPYYQVTLYVKHGNQQPYVCNGGSVTIDTRATYLFTIVKNFNKLSVRLFLLRTNPANEAPVNLLDETDVGSDVNSQSIMFSNKEMVVNAYQNLNGNIYAMGFYNKALNDTAELPALRDHFNKQFEKYSTVELQRQEQVQKYADTITEMKSCPYDDATCLKCGNVIDWSTTNHLLDADSACLATIDDYCTTHPTSERCSCWNPNGVNYNSAVCVNMRNMYKQTSCVNLDNLTDDQVNAVKAKYNLCRCDNAVINPIPMPNLSDYLIPINASGSCPKDGASSAPTPAPPQIVDPLQGFPPTPTQPLPQPPPVTNQTALVEPTREQVSNPFEDLEFNASPPKNTSAQTSGFMKWLFNF